MFLLFSSCGYEAMHSKRNIVNYDFSIAKLTLTGDRDTNIKVKEKLNNYTLSKKDKNFIVKIKSTSEKVILAKDIAGDPTSFRSTTIIFVEVLLKDNIKKTFEIKESFNYNNNSDNFSLKSYEREIKNNLAESYTDKLIFKLSNIK